MRRQRRKARGVEQLRMRFPGELQYAGDRDVGMADALSEPVGRCDDSTLRLQRLKHAADLRSQRSTQIFRASFRNTRS